MATVDYNDPASMFRALGAGPGHLPFPEIVGPEHVRLQSRQSSAQIFSDWKLLNDILDRHEATVQKRWAKKTKNQRVEILLTAWPKMSATHRPDFAAFRREGMQDRETGTKFREAYMWPYINLEDLSKLKTLPLFLHARARNAPDVFALADGNAVHLGIVSKAIVPKFMNDYTMMFNNRKAAESYGELIAWDDHEDAFEMQQRTLSFLVDCCKRIMHDVPADKLMGDEFPVQPRPQLVSETAEGFASLAVMAAEAPYRSPANMDLARLESLFTAKVGAAEDHVWSLREDPSYFAEALWEFREHRQEMIKDWNGREHPLFRQNRQDILWQRIIGNVVASALLELEVWTELLSQVRELQGLQTKYAAIISPNENLPEEYLGALLKFQHYLNQASKGPMGVLKQAAVASPPLRPHFVREPVENPATTKIGVSTKPGTKLDKTEEQLLWLLRLLGEDGHQLFLAGLTTVVDDD
ncbi:hypothetical protein LTR37_018503 [Vermiconidia calcicola]|uniref:Uncharacterized protein n=1 Tax=Vermiconidia calcicola TaxID=1690605 RepID=A0ACC3MHV0_9PEZI|nr:hypothetical protein LTR37_018503 [Vermiconidia calcicola]